MSQRPGARPVPLSPLLSPRLRLDEFRDWPEGKGPIEFLKAVLVAGFGIVVFYLWFVTLWAAS